MPDYMSHERMKAEIEAGRSVLHQGRIITKVENLPSPGELAGVDGLKDEEAELEARLKATREKRAAAEKAAAAEKKAAEKADEADDEKATAKKSGGK